MRSLVCLEPGSVAMEERPTPQRLDNEALIRIRRVGLCGSDIHIFHGRQPYLSYPRVMGHEFAGDIEAVSEDSGFAIGDRVVVLPYLSCGTCVACRHGKTNCCTKLEVLGVHRDGALADYVCVPTQFILKADGLSLDEAAMVEFLAIGAHAVRRANIAPSQSILIVGAGPIGLAACLFSQLAGAQVTMVDTRNDRLEFAARELAVDHIVPLSNDIEAQLRAITNDDFFDVVFDATGNPDAMETGFGYVAHGGTYVLISVVTSDIRFTDSEFHKREMTLLASRNATIEDFKTVMQAMREGKVPTAMFASHRADLDDLPTTLLDWIDPTNHVIKALIEV